MNDLTRFFRSRGAFDHEAPTLLNFFDFAIIEIRKSRRAAVGTAAHYLR